ncbi:hypothetical protein OsccyDRAFT_1523 [Leptolyngbyaceae cyanobacterium JSC-12]|nr:hypothetical protein OsccyDRAFT_1523 [Leptolyngbyaceae cyanobacterium JSC-12]
MKLQTSNLLRVIQRSLLPSVILSTAYLIEQPVLAIQTYEWGQGQRPQPMMSLDQGVCWLTAVQGKFMGGAEVVRVSLRGNQWFLSGGSYQEGVVGQAKCATWSELGASPRSLRGPYQWRNGNRAAVMEGSLCFISAVSGNFRGGGESVAIRQSGSSYVLTGISQQDFVYGEAHCISPFDTVRQRLEWSPGSRPIQLRTQCFLQRIAGTFNGGGERVGIFGDGYGTLTGSYISGDGVWAEVLCSGR